MSAWTAGCGLTATEIVIGKVIRNVGFSGQVAVGAAIGGHLAVWAAVANAPGGDADG